KENGEEVAEQHGRKEEGAPSLNEGRARSPSSFTIGPPRPFGAGLGRMPPSCPSHLTAGAVAFDGSIVRDDLALMPMPDLQLRLWREASRADDLPEAVNRMTALLARRVPLGRVFLRRFDPEAETLETLAVGQVVRGPVPGAARTACTVRHLAELRGLANGSVVMLNGSSALTGAVLPPGVRGAAAAGPLTEPDGGPLGVLVAVPVPGAELDETACEVLGRSLEPFAAALAHHRRVHELERLREAAEAEKNALLTRLHRREIVEEIVGAEGSLRAVMTRVEQVAPTDAPVLILGETGTGKEVIARAIHARSARADGPIVRVN